MGILSHVFGFLSQMDQWKGQGALTLLPPGSTDREAMTFRRFVIFDLDGTLCDSRMDIARAVNAGLASVGLPPVAPAVVTDFVGDGVGRLVDRSVTHVGGDLALVGEVAAELLSFYRKHPVIHTRPYPGVDEVLAAAGGRPLAVASNKPTDLCLAIVRAFGWEQRFRAVLGIDWGGPKKPSPQVLLYLAEILGRDPTEGVMVGDSAADVEAGKCAGMATVAALYGFRPREQLLALRPDAAMEHMSELPGILARLDGP